LNAGDLPKLTVYLNTVSLKTYNPGAIISKVIRFKPHELYDKKTPVRGFFFFTSLSEQIDLCLLIQANDIGLLTLDTNITTLYPQTLVEDDSTTVGKNGTILRWGAGKGQFRLK